MLEQTITKLVVMYEAITNSCCCSAKEHYRAVVDPGGLQFGATDTPNVCGAPLNDDSLT